MQPSSPVDISRHISGSEQKLQAQNDILVLNKEYNDLCDQCDSLDARHLALVSEQNATEITLSQINANAQTAREELDVLNAQIEESERRWVELRAQDEEHLRLLDARALEDGNYVKQQQDMQNTLRELETNIKRLQVHKVELNTNLCSLQQACEETKSQHVLHHTESQSILESMRGKINECDAEYVLAVERADTQRAQQDALRLEHECQSENHRAEQDAMRLEHERQSENQRASLHEQLEPISQAIADKKAELGALDTLILQTQCNHNEQQAALSEIALAFASRQLKNDTAQLYMQQQIDEHENTLQDMVATCDAKRSVLQHQLDAKEEDLISLQQSIECKQTELNALVGGIATATAAVDVTRLDENTLQDMVATCDAKRGVLQHQLDAKEEDLISLQQSIECKQTELNALVEDIATATAAVDVTRLDENAHSRPAAEAVRELELVTERAELAIYNLRAEHAETVQEMNAALMAQAAHIHDLTENAKRADIDRVAENARIAEVANLAEHAKLAEDAKSMQAQKRAEKKKRAEEARLDKIAHDTQDAIRIKAAQDNEAAHEAKLAREAQDAIYVQGVEDDKAAHEAQMARDAEDATRMKAAEDEKATNHARAVKKAQKIRVKQAEEIAYAAGEAAGLQKAWAAAAEKAEQEAQQKAQQETCQTPGTSAPRHTNAIRDMGPAQEHQIAQGTSVSTVPHSSDALFPHTLEDDEFERMLNSISPEPTCTSPRTVSRAKDSLVEASEAHRIALHADLEILQRDTIAAQKACAELEQHSNHLHACVDEKTAVLLQTQTDLEICNRDLEACRIQQAEISAAHQLEEETAFATMQQHSELLRETQSSIDFMTQNKELMIRSMDEMRLNRDNHDLKLEKIRCYGNTLSLAMTELHSAMHLRHSSVEFQIKIETVLDLFNKFLDWFENTFTVSLYAFTCILNNSRTE